MPHAQRPVYKEKGSSWWASSRSALRLASSSATLRLASRKRPRQYSSSSEGTSRARAATGAGPTATEGLPRTGRGECEILLKAPPFTGVVFEPLGTSARLFV